MTRRARSGIGAWLIIHIALCLAVAVSSRIDPSELGAPGYWTWDLTGLQVMALWVTGRRYVWGWMVGRALRLREQEVCISESLKPSTIRPSRADCPPLRPPHRPDQVCALSELCALGSTADRAYKSPDT